MKKRLQTKLDDAFTLKNQVSWEQIFNDAVRIQNKQTKIGQRRTSLACRSIIEKTSGDPSLSISEILKKIKNQ